ncbi:MAG: cohesin domain-containing protein [Terriglobia bacterium]
MIRPLSSIVGLVLVALLASACPKGKDELKKGQKAELAKDYDGALIHYERALQADPNKAEYQLRAKRMRFEAAQMHVDRGHKLRDQGLLEPAAAEFEKALAIDPSSFVAEQELRRTLQMIVAQRQAQAQQATRNEQSSATPPPAGALEGPARLQPLARAPLTLQVTEDARRVFETIAKLAKINVIFDPDFQPRRITVQLQEATLEQALDIVALMTGTFWKAVTPNTIMVIPDTAAKRRAYEEQIIKTFYLSNTIQAAELNEIVQALRTLLDIKRITPSTANNAIIIRDTPDKMAVAEKIIRDVDQAKPEVVIQVAILQARRDRARELGILPSTSVPLLFTPRGAAAADGDGDGNGAAPGSLRLSDLDTLSSADYSIILPSFTAMALLTDADTKIIQNPEVRTTDGQTAKLRIGDKVPFAVGSFQPGIGGVGVNPLVNTQFQFQDVGVNLDITPRVHSNREISMRVSVEVSSVTGRVNIGGIEQPIFGQRTIEHDIRLREGEVSILGGIIERSETVSVQGWPGLGQIPGLRYLFSSERKEEMENEVLIALTPRLVRVPAITPENLRALAVGTDEKVSLPRSNGPLPPEAEAPPAPTAPLPPTPPGETQPDSSSAPAVQGPAEIGFQPPQTRVATGERVAVNIVLKNVQNLFAVPFALRFDPAVVELAEVHHGGFLGGGKQPAALVHRVDKETGTAFISLSRPPASGGISGDGALVTLVFRGLAPGRTQLTIENIAARNALQEAMDIRSSVAEILVE